MALPQDYRDFPKKTTWFPPNITQARLINIEAINKLIIKFFAMYSLILNGSAINESKQGHISPAYRYARHQWVRRATNGIRWTADHYACFHERYYYAMRTSYFISWNTTEIRGSYKLRCESYAFGPLPPFLRKSVMQFDPEALAYSNFREVLSNRSGIGWPANGNLRTLLRWVFRSPAKTPRITRRLCAEKHASNLDFPANTGKKDWTVFKRFQLKLPCYKIRWKRLNLLT